MVSQIATAQDILRQDEDIDTSRVAMQFRLRIVYSSVLNEYTSVQGIRYKNLVGIRGYSRDTHHERQTHHVFRLIFRSDLVR